MSKNSKKNLLIFIVSLVVPMIYYRLLVSFFYTDKVSIIRELTNLTIHHVHYGIVLVTISLLLLIFYKKNTISIILGGVGLGLVLDEFIPSLFLNLSREVEIAAYNQGLIGTLILFISLVILSILVWFLNSKKS